MRDWLSADFPDYAALHPGYQGRARMAFSPDQLPDILSHEPAPAGILVAFSGGRDSTVLLHALAAVREQLAAAPRAVHINHGLHPEAAQWSRQCENIAAQLGVDYISRRVDVDPADPRGLEAAARAARYAALDAELRPGECLLTAHHADDQLETVLLQLLRGGGPAGIAAMPARAPFGAGWLVRPLLGFDRQALAAYADANDLDCIDDPSNTDRQRDRNYLRHGILPRLKERWPAAAVTVGRAARHAAQAQTLLTDLAALDLAQVAQTDAETLPVEGVLDLGRARAENLLRYWLTQRKLPVPDTRRLNTLLSQTTEAAGDKAPQVLWPGAEARCWRSRIYAFPPREEPPALPAQWHGEPLNLGAAMGELRAVAGKGKLRADVLAEGVELHWRRGGERIRIAGQQHRRELK
ncbi:MAG TPA: tRNA lysidine(34) synthetase TilS, partial [Gammaproteobacteria bacterium]|nr:tRNA lysidine(34) synthetase TilS [Gammaproteobacteria bacterium]